MTSHTRIKIPAGFWLLLRQLGIAAHDVVRKAQVAFLIGYEDQNSFYRALRLWEGDTPSNWRTEHLGTNSIN